MVVVLILYFYIVLIELVQNILIFRVGIFEFFVILFRKEPWDTAGKRFLEALILTFDKRCSSRQDTIKALLFQLTQQLEHIIFDSFLEIEILQLNGEVDSLHLSCYFAWKLFVDAFRT